MNGAEPMMRRLRAVAGTGAVERLGPDAVRLALRALLFDGAPVPEWHGAAACRHLDPAVFFVEPGPHAAWQARKAKRICRRCPVRAACLADVMAWEPASARHGVVGGLSPAERHRLSGHQRAQQRQHRKSEGDGR